MGTHGSEATVIECTNDHNGAMQRTTTTLRNGAAVGAAGNFARQASTPIRTHVQRQYHLLGLGFLEGVLLGLGPRVGYLEGVGVGL